VWGKTSRCSIKGWKPYSPEKKEERKTEPEDKENDHAGIPAAWSHDQARERGRQDGKQVTAKIPYIGCRENDDVMHRDQMEGRGGGVGQRPQGVDIPNSTNTQGGWSSRQGGRAKWHILGGWVVGKEGVSEE